MKGTKMENPFNMYEPLMLFFMAGIWTKIVWMWNPNKK